MAELPLPAGATSYLVTARDQIVEAVDAWGTNYWESDTIGHAGRVTQEFLRREGARAPRSVITCIDASSERVGGGKSTQFAPTWQWFIVVAGVLADRTEQGLILAGEGVRLVYRSPWADVVDSAFSRIPVDGSVRMRALYQDEDEKTGLSIWGIQWRQAVDLGSAGRTPSPVGQPLELIAGTDTIPGSPNTDIVKTRVE